MPELPEVETVRRGLEPVMLGQRFAAVRLARPDLRFPFPSGFALRLKGRTVDRLSRRAKYLVATLDDGTSLIMHLGMSGAFRIEGVTVGAFHYPRGKLAVHDHVAFDFGSTRVIYNDPRRFGFMTLAEPGALVAHPLFAHLGVEPTADALTAPILAGLVAGKRTPIKAALLDQRLIAGLGNIYVCEALWRARVSPRRTAASLPRRDGTAGQRVVRLADAIVAVIEEAIAAGGSSLRDYVAADGSMGRFQHTFAVYGKAGEPCPRPACRGVIARTVQSGRSSFYCPVCQR